METLKKITKRWITIFKDPSRLIFETKKRGKHSVHNKPEKYYVTLNVMGFRDSKLIKTFWMSVLVAGHKSALSLFNQFRNLQLPWSSRGHRIWRTSHAPTTSLPNTRTSFKAGEDADPSLEGEGIKLESFTF